jgi:hypothetical protein
MKTILLGVWLSFGSDAAATHYAITQRAAREVLIPTQSPWALDGIVAGEAALTSLGLYHLNHNHPKAAKLIGWSIIGLRSVVVYHNVNELRKR